MKTQSLLRRSGVAGLLFVMLLVLARCSGGDGLEVTSEKVTKKNITETVSAAGKVQPEVELKLSSNVSGEIVELLVKEGDKVEKGQLLLRIDPEIYKAELDRMAASVNGSRANLANARARLSQVKAQLINAEASYNRNKKLFDQNAISQSEWDAAKSAYEVAKAEVEAAEESVRASEFSVKSSEASLQQSNENLKKTTIYAPVSGTVSKLNKEIGENVVGTAQMEGTEILRIANLNEMEVSVAVSENDIVRVNVGDTSIVTVDAFLPKKFQGVVTEIANSANTLGVSAEQVTDYTVKIRILRSSYQDLIDKKNPHLSPFRSGMTATVDIQTERVKNVVAVPLQAITNRDKEEVDKPKKEDKKGGEEEEDGELVVRDATKDKQKQEEEPKAQEVVFVVREGKAVLTKVKTGINDGHYIQILEGLKDGDEVITGPYSHVSKLLKDGTEVQIVSKDKVYSGEKK